MDKLKKLEIDRLIRELDYIQSDYNYKSEVIQVADKEFLDSVNKIVDSHPQLKVIYDQKVRKVYTQNCNSSCKVEDSNKEENVDVVDLNFQQQKDPKLKSLYRNIVKKTHPDKVNESKLNQLYIDSTKYYEDDDIISIYKICDRLGIDWEYEDNDYYLIQNKIAQLKEKIRFVEGTFTWAWLNSDPLDKEGVILNFVKTQLL